MTKAGCLPLILLASVACSSTPADKPQADLEWTPAPAAPNDVFKPNVPLSATTRGTRRARTTAINAVRRQPFALPADLSSADSLRVWMTTARPAFIKKLGAQRSRAPLQLKVIERVTTDDIERTEIEYMATARFRVSAYLYRARTLQPPAPGVLLLHGHHSGGKTSAAVVGDRKYGEFGGALDLARAGYVVLTPDIRSFGASGNRKAHEHVVKIMLLEGRTAVGAFVADGWRAVDVLTQVRGVDPERLGVAGLSLGGQLSIYLAATDARIKAAAVQGYLASHKGTHLRRWHCICQYMPGMAGLMDIADAAALTAPRPMLFVLGRKDHEFPLGEAKKAFARIQKAYELLGAEEAARIHVHPGRHEWLGPPAVAFFDEFLKTSTGRR